MIGITVSVLNQSEHFCPEPFLEIKNGRNCYWYPLVSNENEKLLNVMNDSPKTDY